MTAIAKETPRLPAAPIVNNNPIINGGPAAPNKMGAVKGLGMFALNGTTAGAPAGPVDNNSTRQESMDWNALQNLETSMLAKYPNVSTLKADAQSRKDALGEVRQNYTIELRAAAVAKIGEAEVKKLELKAADRVAVWQKVYMPGSKVEDKGNPMEQLDVEKSRLFAVAAKDDAALQKAADVATAAELNRRLGAAAAGGDDRKAIYAHDGRYDGQPGPVEEPKRTLRDRVKLTIVKSEGAR